LPGELAEVVGLGEDQSARRADFESRPQRHALGRRLLDESVSDRCEIDRCRLARSEVRVLARFVLAEAADRIGESRGAELQRPGPPEGGRRQVEGGERLLRLPTTTATAAAIAASRLIVTSMIVPPASFGDAAIAMIESRGLSRKSWRSETGAGVRRAGSVATRIGACGRSSTG
jgi:hypothetical protein